MRYCAVLLFVRYLLSNQISYPPSFFTEPFPAAPLLATPKPPIRKAQIRNVNWYKQVVNAVTRPSTGKRKRVNPLFSPDGDVHLTLPKGEWSMHSIAEPNTFSDTTNTFRMSAGKPLIRDSPKKRNYDATNAEDASIRLNLRGFLEEDKRRKMKNPRKKACASSSMWSTHRTFSNRPGLFSMQNLSQALCPEKRNSNAKNEFGAESDGDDWNNVAVSIFCAINYPAVMLFWRLRDCSLDCSFCTDLRFSFCRFMRWRFVFSDTDITRFLVFLVLASIKSCEMKLKRLAKRSQM